MNQIGYKVLSTWISIIVAFFLIIAGGVIYIFMRPLSLRMFKWASVDESTQWLVSVRQRLDFNVDDWVIYALPDGLWACSYVIFVGVIWGFDFKRSFWIVSIVPIIGLLSEFLQTVRLLPGVFDWCDVICYALGWILGLTYIKCIEILIKKTKYEENLAKNR